MKTCVSAEIVLGVNTAMKEFEREQELAALYFKPKDDRVVDVEKAFQLLTSFQDYFYAITLPFAIIFLLLFVAFLLLTSIKGAVCMVPTQKFANAIFSKEFSECSYFQMCTPGYEVERLKHPNSG